MQNESKSHIFTFILPLQTQNKKDLYGQKPQQALKPYRSNHY